MLTLLRKGTVKCVINLLLSEDHFKIQDMKYMCVCIEGINIAVMHILGISSNVLCAENIESSFSSSVEC